MTVAHVVHLDISNVSVAFAVLGVFIVVYGLFSYTVKERLYLSESLIAVLFGIITGPYVLGWVDPLSWSDDPLVVNQVTYQFTRLAIGVQVLFTGISLPKAYLRREALSLSVLLFAVMTIAWLVTAGLIYALFRPLTFLEALAISAAVTPTDPVLANSITKGRYAEKHVPENVRNIIVAESGANDGLGFPFLFLAIYLMRRTGEDAGLSIGQEIGRWLYGVVVYQILLSCVYGALVGYIARKTLRWAEARGYIDKDNFFAYGLGLALFVLGTTGMFGSDDILAAFIAGNSFTWDDWFRVRTQDQEADSFQDILDMLFSASVFIYVGAIIPWGDYATGGTELGIDPWRIVVLGILVLLVRRLPWVVGLSKFIPALTNLNEAIFAGFFGPIGISAVFYIQVALRELPEDGTRDRLRALYTPIVMFCVFSSVLAHGSTISISKLGPHIVRRTVTLTQTRSFTSRPTSRQPSLHESATQKASSPIKDALDGFKSFALAWRKDSWWRRTAPVQSRVISGPTGAHKQSEMEERKTVTGSSDNSTTGDMPDSDVAAADSEPATQATTSDDNVSSRRGRRTPPPALELPTVAPAVAPAISLPGSTGTSTPADPTHPPPAAQKGHVQRQSDGFLRGLHEGLKREIAAERREALEEADTGWPQEVRDAAAAEDETPSTPTRSSRNAALNGGIMETPGTPTGGRVHFGQH